MKKTLNDGLLRLSRRELGDMQLMHLISGLDDEEPEAGNKPYCGGSVALCGYTEWVSAQNPQLTLGWDWQFDSSATSPRVVRLGLPRTNVLVVDSTEAPLPWDESLHVLARFIDTFDWNTPAFNAVCDRYA